MNEFFDLIKNLLVVCCLLATLSATCRQEQTRDRIDAKIDALLSSGDFQHIGDNQ